MLDTPMISVLQAGLDYASVRQEALSDNIANINTPGYKRKDASFDSVLASASAQGQSDLSSFIGLRTSSSHLKIGADPSDVQVESGDDSGEMRLDGNNVDLDVEMGRLAKNQIYYQGLSQLIAGQFSALKAVIESK